MTSPDAAAHLDPLPEFPAVSYVMPVLNEASHLAQAVHAVLGQEYPGEQELVLALGNSSDATDEVAGELAASDSRVKLVHNPRNDIPIGVNLAIAASHHRVGDPGGRARRTAARLHRSHGRVPAPQRGRQCREG